MNITIGWGDSTKELEEVARTETAVLYRFDGEGYVCGASKEEILEEFPDYNYTMEDNFYDFLIEKNGRMRFSYEGNTLFSDEDVYSNWGEDEDAENSFDNL